MKWISDEIVAHLQDVTHSPDLSGTKYSLVSEIGRGGMAVVYLAHDNELDRDVALKILNLTDITATMVARMLSEARVIAQLEHPGIVPVHDVGTLSDGRVFYAMKLVRGRRLDKHIEDLESVFDRLRVFLKVCDAVAFAHASGVIHRDLKPENIMVGPFGEVLVMDWGTVKLIEVAENGPEKISQDGRSNTAALTPISRGTFPANNTDHGTIVGTPAYMSPEQATGALNVDARSDIYALGAVLYFLLTGCPPMHDQKKSEVSAATASSSPMSPMPPRALNRKVARRLEAICLKAMSENAKERYATVEGLALDVSHFLEDKPVSAYREGIVERALRWSSRNRFLILIILAYLLIRIFLIILARR